MTQEEAEFAGKQVLSQLQERKQDRHKIISMANSQQEFNPALPLPVKFTVQDGKYGPQLSLFIPTESVTHLMDHIQNLVNTKTAGGSVYLGKPKGTVKTEGIYINAKALESDDGNGFFGQINPQKIENVSSSQGLF
jgi:hypothetical protein